MRFATKIPPAPGTFSKGLTQNFGEFAATTDAPKRPGLPPGAAAASTSTGPFGILLRVDRSREIGGAECDCKVHGAKFMLTSLTAGGAPDLVGQLDDQAKLSFLNLGVTGLPVSTLAKPHQGLTAKRSSATCRVASSIRRCKTDLSSRTGAWKRNQAKRGSDLCF